MTSEAAAPGLPGPCLLDVMRNLAHHHREHDELAADLRRQGGDGERTGGRFRSCCIRSPT